MAEPIRREFRPPPPVQADRVLNYSDPRIEREIARRWRRHHLRELWWKASAVAGVALIIGIWFALKFFFGITICVIPL